MECRSLRDSGEAIREFDVAYFAASVDDAETNKRFAESVEADYPILSDPEKIAAKVYGVVNARRGFAQRWTFYIDEKGAILEIDKRVRPANAGETIAKKLGELGFPKKTN